MKFFNTLCLSSLIVTATLISVIIYQEVKFNNHIKSLDNKIEYLKKYQFFKNQAFEQKHNVFEKSHVLIARNLVAKDNHIKKRTKIQYFDIWINN